jgi:hypothetical protein
VGRVVVVGRVVAEEGEGMEAEEGQGVVVEKVEEVGMVVAVEMEGGVEKVVGEAREVVVAGVSLLRPLRSTGQCSPRLSS